MEKVKDLSAGTDCFFMKQLNEVTFKSSNRFWLETLISQTLECVKRHWTTKSERVFYFYVCLLMHAVVSS